VLGAADLIAINLEILHTTISGFGGRGYSGDLEFRMQMGQIMRSKLEIYLEHSSEGKQIDAGVLANIASHWPAIDIWMEHPTTSLQVSFQRGRITRVRIKESNSPL